MTKRYDVGLKWDSTNNLILLHHVRICTYASENIFYIIDNKESFAVNDFQNCGTKNLTGIFSKVILNFRDKLMKLP